MNSFGVIEIASSKATHTPGWAYVPDTGVNPASFQPTNRKRAARERANYSLSDVSARQETKIRKELEALDRDNNRDVNIPIPPRPGGSKPQNKHTANVRKILQSQKTFANHLDDYQAMLALSDNNPSSAAGANAHSALKAAAAASSSSSTPRQTSTAPSGIKRSGSARKSAAPSSSKSRRRVSTPAKAATAAAPTGDPEDVEMPDADAAATPSEQATGSDQQPQQQQQQQFQPSTSSIEKPRPTEYPPDGTILPAYRKPPPRKHPGDSDPLLVSRVPPFPSDDELRALVAAPPLSYLEARARWPNPTGPEDGGEEAAGGSRRYPTRRFCEVCGYWGRVRCNKCGAGMCALDCLDVHREECVTRYGL